MTTKSPLEQAQARILALEAEVDRLASKRESNLESAERAMDKVERLMDERDALMDRATAAEAALRDLRAAQNGPPLIRDSQAWTLAMQKADDVLERSRAGAGSGCPRRISLGPCPTCGKEHYVTVPNKEG